MNIMIEFVKDHSRMPVTTAWFQLPPRFRGDFFLKNKNLRGNKNKMLGLRGEISLRGHNDCTIDKIFEHHQPHLKQKPKDVL